MVEVKDVCWVYCKLASLLYNFGAKTNQTETISGETVGARDFPKLGSEAMWNRVKTKNNT